MSAQLIIALVVSLVILIGNTMLAIAFLRGRRSDWTSSSSSLQDAMDELHRRVRDLTGKQD